MRTTALRLVGLVAATTLAAGCGEKGNVTSPAVVGSSAHQTGGSPATVSVVIRDTPLGESVSTSAVIGAFGGTLRLPGAGLTVVVPPFALASPTRITVTAVAGSQVVYEFEPHGTQFLAPVVVTQNLDGTNAMSGGILLHTLTAGYFGSLSDLDPLAGTASVSELFSTSVSLVTKTVTFPVVHFSGYLIATGAEASGDSVSHP